MLKTLIKTKHISTMSLNFYLVFFILSTSSWFTSALKCYKCEEKNPDADLINSFCSRLYNKNSWEIVECSGSCFSGSKPNPNVQGRRVGQRFVNPTYCSRALKSRSKLRAAIGLRAAFENFYYIKIQIYVL